MCLCVCLCVCALGKSTAMLLSVCVRVLALCVCVCVCGPPCLVINEVNCDNPKLDTHEFVELFHSSGSHTFLDGYTLVFYNGNGNQAYRVLDLSGHSTDQRGFFLIGSAELQPRPAITLPPNSVQNGPDAIALYGPDWAGVVEGGGVSAQGLLDAVVYSTRRSPDGANGLAAVLTPGLPAFLEDAGHLEGDESMLRCWETGHAHTFHLDTPTPGARNHCPPPDPPHIRINEVGLGRQSGMVELSVGTATGPHALVVIDGRTDLISESADLDTSKPGLISPDARSLDGDFDVGAVAVYEGNAADFPKDGPLSQKEPIDAFVFGGLKKQPSDTLTETLIPGRQFFQLNNGLSEGGIYLSRCGVAAFSRDPGVFLNQSRSRGDPNSCYNLPTCPRKAVVAEGTLAPPLPPWHGDGDFLLNEVNADSPGAGEDGEFVELWHTSGHRVALGNLWLVLVNGRTGKPYREIGLHGYFTNRQGYFLVGSDKLHPPPAIALPPNTVQNGPDAVVLYRTSGPEPSEVDSPTLLDAVVYRASGSDKEAPELTSALTPGQLPLLEDPSALPGDESLTRCSLGARDLSAFRVAPPTPWKENDCPRPPKGVVINEVGGTFGIYHTNQTAFVELIGPPQTDLQGLAVLLFEGGASGSSHTLPLSGSIGSDGLYLLGNQSGADQWLPALAADGAVALCYDASGVCGSDSVLLDSVLFSDDLTLLSTLSANRGQQIHIRSVLGGPVSLSRCSCCDVKTPVAWTTSSPTPRLQNLCPSPAFASPIHLCLQPDYHDWQEQSGNCSDEKVAGYLEQICDCGITALYLQGLNVSCASGRVYVQGTVLALSDHQRELIIQTTQNTHTCYDSSHNRELQNTGSAVGLQVGLVLGAVLLLGLGGALFIYLYKKRRPLDYYSMELNEHAASPVEL